MNEHTLRNLIVIALGLALFLIGVIGLEVNRLRDEVREIRASIAARP